MYIVDAGVLLESVTDVQHTLPVSITPRELPDQSVLVFSSVVFEFFRYTLFLDFSFQLCPNFQLTTSLLSLSISIGSVLFSIFWPNHLCIWKISLWLNMEFMLTLMVLSGLSVTHASHHTTLPSQKMSHQEENTLVPLWNVKSINFSVHFNFFYFLFCLRMTGNPDKEKWKKVKKKRQEGGCTEETWFFP